MQAAVRLFHAQCLLVVLDGFVVVGIVAEIVGLSQQVVIERIFLWRQFYCFLQVFHFQLVVILAEVIVFTIG